MPGVADSRAATLPLGTPEPEQLKNLAKIYFQHLLQSDARQLVAMSAFPFYLEGQRVDGAEPLFQEWLTNLRAKRTDLLSLYGLDVYTPEQMQEKYGPPPARLAKVPLRGKTYVVVANLSGRAAVAVFREVDTMWKVVAFTD